MKKLLVFLSFIFFMSSCEIFNKISVTCDGDCNDPTYLVKGETGTDVTYSNFNNHVTFQGGQISKMTISGTIIYNDSGNSYEVEGVANHSPCNYTITVKNVDGNEATCSN